MATFELNRLISYDNESLLAELRRVTTLVESPYLSASAFDKHSKDMSGIRRRFGGWQQALGSLIWETDIIAEAQCETPSRPKIYGRTTSGRTPRVEKIGGEPVTIGVFNQHASMNAETVRRRFGSWRTALEQAGVVLLESWQTLL